MGTIFGLVGLIWSGYALLSAMTTDAAGIQATLYRSFPGYQEAALTGSSLILVGNSALLAGVFMSFFCHPRSRTVVRVTSWIMIAATVLQAVGTSDLIVGSSTWESLDSPTRGSLMGGIIGGAIGGVIQWGLILFLFRNRLTLPKQP